MKTGWYNDGYFVVKSLHNGYRQSLVMGAEPLGRGYYNIIMGIFPCNIGYKNMINSHILSEPASPNKNPSIKTLTVALEALNEVEQELIRFRNGKRTLVYVEGSDEQRARVYQKVLTKKCNYKISKSIDTIIDFPKLYKTLIK